MGGSDMKKLTVITIALIAITSALGQIKEPPRRQAQVTYCPSDAAKNPWNDARV
jgi:hypothetical protein